MADPNDHSLLSRLNALKPTTVKLDQSTNALDIPILGVETIEPVSREDALLKRLKTLRNTQESGRTSAETQNHGRASSEPPPPEYTEIAEGPSFEFAKSFQKTQQAQPSCVAPRTPKVPQTVNGSAGGSAAYDPSNESDDERTLDDILDSLVIEDDHWSVSDDDDIQSAQKVQDLLASLREEAGILAPSSADDQPRQTRESKNYDNDDGDDDDSEGERMSRKINDVLSRTMDDIKLEGGAAQADTAHPGTITSQDPDQDTNLTLPNVPETPTEEQGEEQDGQLPEFPTTLQPLNGSDEFNLPTVPSILQDPAPASKANDDPFESSIAARLAALKGPGHKPIATDDFGLPSVPSFQPEDRPLRGVAKEAGYTDEDEKSWCLVCLDDATVRCVGCDGVVYCARCWKEMHVGPSAGYDERGHQWEKFDARRV
ncbi:hypothetical protein BD289DRAFT_135687 [Coniella lustricola]|uniref:Abscission/NoCut checkpoint regulator n=1 Tax=Coniella lustricola TaxID=2025994 RepID=A0A2T3AFF2_9PEZI|nr:hypothetical protein BD289DRAFT_135687 [Coniella lustricola]